MDQHLDDFVAHLRRLQRSERTITRYKLDVELWLRSRPQGEGSADQFMDWLAKYSNPRTRITKWTAVRGYVQFLHKRGHISQDWTADVHIRQVQKEDYVLLSKAEVQTLLCCQNSPIPWIRDRNRVLMLILFSTACRNSEIRLLKKDNVNLEEAFIRIRVKGGRTVTSHLTPQAVEALRSWLPRVKGEWVFPKRSNRNAPMSDNRVFQLVCESAVRAGLTKRVSPHCLRRAAATIVYRKTKDLLKVKNLLHHRTLEMATVYARLGSDELAQAQDDALAI